MSGTLHFNEQRSERLTALLSSCHSRLAWYSGFTIAEDRITFHFRCWDRNEGHAIKHDHAFAWLEVDHIVDINLLQQQLDAINDQLSSGRAKVDAVREPPAELATLKKQLDDALPLLEACETTFNLCQGLVRHSTEESDRYWELAEDLMELTAKRLGEKIIRRQQGDD